MSSEGVGSAGDTARGSASAGARRARRGRGEGSIYYQKSRQSWAASISLEGGKRRVIYGKTRKEVADKLAAAIRDVQQGLPLPSQRLTTGQFLAEWLEDTVKPTRRAGTYLRYSTAVRLHIAPTIGNVPLARLGPQHIQRLNTVIASKGLSSASTALVRATLSAAFTQSTKWGLTVRNPVALVDAPRTTAKEPSPLRPDQARRLLEAARGHEFEHLFAVMLTTGLRIGEALGLRWQDVELEQRHIRVRQQLVYVPGRPREFTEPKSVHGRRVVPLIPSAVASLRAQHARVLEWRLQSHGVWQDHDLVFPDEIGRPLVGARVNYVLKRLLKEAGLPKFTPHALRHSTATYLLAAGVPDRVVMEILGHSSITMTTRYEHIMSTMLADVAERLSAIFPSMST
jgi:integrase